MATTYRLVVQVLAIENHGSVKEERKYIDLDPEWFEVETRDGLAAVVRAEAGELAVHLFEKVWDALY